MWLYEILGRLGCAWKNHNLLKSVVRVHCKRLFEFYLKTFGTISKRTCKLARPLPYESIT